MGKRGPRESRRCACRLLPARARLPLWLCLSFGLSGCASAFDGSLESVTVQTTSDAKPLAGAECTLSDHKGTWIVTTPGSVTVHRGSEPLQVTCIKDGYALATDPQASSTNVGSILLQGAIISTVSGSAWSYPQMIMVPMLPSAQ